MVEESQMVEFVKTTTKSPIKVGPKIVCIGDTAKN